MWHVANLSDYWFLFFSRALFAGPAAYRNHWAPANSSAWLQEIKRWSPVGPSADQTWKTPQAAIAEQIHLSGRPLSHYIFIIICFCLTNFSKPRKTHHAGCVGVCRGGSGCVGGRNSLGASKRSCKGDLRFCNPKVPC